MSFAFKQGDRPLPGYTIQRGVGRGGFGEVYYATSDGGKEVALKYLRENPQIELRGVTHCLNLKSPYLVALHDIKENAEGEFFVVMEYVSGPSMRDLMNEEPKGLGVQKAAYFLREIAKGLAYLHDRGIVHRDMKPGNIFYEDGYVKIGDYGLAKIMSASQHSGQTVSVGTVHYMAPEVGSGNYDRTIDIYSMGVILYEMLLGRVPFTGQTMGEVLMKHLTAQPEVDNLPEPFSRVIRKALAKDPKDRYQTVNEMIAEVFAADELDRSVAAFEPASLSTVAARATERARLAVGVAMPVGAGGGGPLGTGSSNVGVTPPPVITQPVTARPVGRIDRWHDRVGVRIDRLADRIDQTRVGREVAEAAHRRGHWAERLTIGLLVSSGIAFGVSALGHNGNIEFAIEVFSCILSVAGGALAGCWLSQQRWRIQGKWLSRVIVTCAVGVLLLVFGAAVESAYLWHQQRLSEWIRTLLLVALFCDWPGRFREGREGKVRLGAAFSAGLFTFIAGMVLTGGEDGFTLAAVAAAASLTLQSIAGIWSPTRGAPAVPSPGGSSPDDGRFAAAQDRAEDAPPIIERWPAERGQSPWAEPAPPPIAGPAVPPVVHQAVAPVLPLRSPVVRTLWLLLAAALLCGAVLAFASTGLVRDLSSDEKADCVIGGIAASAYSLFALSRVPRRRKSGLWRGILRPAIFFTGLAAAGGAGAAMGMLNFRHEEEQLIPLAFILGGAVVSLFVWFIPVLPYVQSAARPPEEEEIRRARLGQRLMVGGGAILALTLVILVLMLITVHKSDWDEAIPALVGPMTTIAAILLVTGAIMRHPRRRRAATPKLSLPLRAAFDIYANPNLSRLIERHLTLLGYTLASKTDLLWSFTRGSWAHQFLQQDIRRWRTKLNVAAYELYDGGYRITCLLDVDTTFNRPDQRMMAALNEELDDLRRLLDGRDAAPKSGEVHS